MTPLNAVGYFSSGLITLWQTLSALSQNRLSAFIPTLCDPLVSYWNAPYW